MFRVNYRGLDVVVDSLEDLDRLADRMTKPAKRPQAPRGSHIPTSADPAPLPRPAEQAAPAPTSAQTSVSSEKTLVDVVRVLPVSRQDLLRLLLHEDRTDIEVRQHLGLKSNRDLAGIMGSISKRLKAAGLDDDLISSEHSYQNRKRVYRYHLRTDARSMIRAALERPDGK